MGGARVRVYMFEGSNSCLTGVLMLRHKQIAYDRIDLPPAAHAFMVRFHGFPKTTVPAMVIDGERVQGTLDISESLDEKFSGNPLFPSDPEARSRVRESEVWGEKLQRATRRIFYGAARRDRRVFSKFLQRGELSAATWLFVRATTPLIIRLASKGHGSTDERVQEDLRRLPENLDRIDAWLADGTLGGERLNAADHQIGPNVRAMLEFYDLQPLLEGRPCARWARRVVPKYGAPVGPVLAPEWLDGLSRGESPGGVAFP
jgi:glutathione S-transferase